MKQVLGTRRRVKCLSHYSRPEPPRKSRRSRARPGKVRNCPASSEKPGTRRPAARYGCKIRAVSLAGTRRLSVDFASASRRLLRFPPVRASRSSRRASAGRETARARSAGCRLAAGEIPRAVRGAGASEFRDAARACRCRSRAHPRGSGRISLPKGSGRRGVELERCEYLASPSRLNCALHGAQSVGVQVGGDDESLVRRQRARAAESFRPARRTDRARGRPAERRAREESPATLHPESKFLPARNASVRAGLPPLTANAVFSNGPASTRSPACLKLADDLVALGPGRARRSSSRGARCSLRARRSCAFAEARKPSLDHPLSDANAGCRAARR